MGQTESANRDDYSCFRACIKQKKAADKKLEALPPLPGNKPSKIRQKNIYSNRNPVKSQSTQSTKKEKAEDEGFQTSLDQRLAAYTGRIKKNCSVQSFSIGAAVEPKESPFVEQQIDPINDIFLGLESKFIPKKVVRYTSAQKTSSLRPSTLRMSVSPIQRYSSNKKQYTSQDETASKSNHTSSSTQSRNILLNKIESIKQKYFQRELEIEIYQDEKEYQRQIDQLNEIERTFTEDNCGLPNHSIGEIKAIRDKILKKLREKKNEKTKEQSTTNNVFEDISLDFKKNKITSSHEELQIYSREERADDTLNESQRSKKPKKMKKSLSYSGKQDKSLNKSSNGILPEVSVDEKMQFSQYSEESLHAIRQLDQEQEEYKSKMSHFASGVNKKSYNQMKSFRKNIPSEVKNSIVSNKPSKLAANEHCQYEEAQPVYYSRHSHISPPSRLAVGRQPQNSALSDYKSKQQSINGVHYSKNNKILLF